MTVVAAVVPQRLVDIIQGNNLFAKRFGTSPMPRALDESTISFDSRAACTVALCRRLVPRPILHCLVETGCHVLLELLGVLHDLVHLPYYFLVRLGQRSSGFHVPLTDISSLRPKSAPALRFFFSGCSPLEVRLVKVHAEIIRRPWHRIFAAQFAVESYPSSHGCFTQMRTL